MRKLLIALLLIGTFQYGNSQINLPVFYGQGTSLADAQYMPSEFGKSRHRVYVDIIGYYIYGGNNRFSNGDIGSIFGGANVDSLTLNSLFSDLSDKNYVDLGVHLRVPTIGISLRKKDLELVNFFIGANERLDQKFSYSRNILNLARYGNARYAGENFELGPFNYYLLYRREFFLGVSRSIVKVKGIQLRGGAIFKYIQGFSGVQTKGANAFLYTDPDGRYLDFNYSYSLDYALPDFQNFSPTTPLGKGFGTTLGVSADVKKNITVSVSVVDLGSVKFTEGAMNASSSGAVRFEGVEVDAKGNVSGPDQFIDDIANPVIVERDFRMNLPTRLVAQGEFHFRKKVSKKGRERFAHNVYTTIAQGLHSFGPAKNTWVSVGYVNQSVKWQRVGVSLGVKDFSQFLVGAFTSWEPGPFRVTIGAGNLTALILPGLGKGLDLGGSISLAF